MLAGWNIAKHFRRILAMLLLLCLGTQAIAASQPAARPNIVMIVSDDQAWGDYSFMGHPRIRTPALDQLASQSLVYTRGYVPSSLCRPSLATMITGLYPHQHRILGNDPAKEPKNTFKERVTDLNARLEKLPTLPRLLASQGYLCFQTGKWWEGHYSTGGFTHGMSQGDRSHGGRHGDEGLKIGREGLKPITDFLDTAASEHRPFFIWYAPMMPHQPHTPPQRLLEKYRAMTPSIHIARYWAMVEWFDETCGQLLQELSRRGLAENTIVVYVTDNGWIQSPDKQAFAARSKQSPYDGGLRTPIMIRWPGKIQPRREDQHAVSSIDLMPTLLELTGLKGTPGAPASLPGVNLLDEKAFASRPAIFGEIYTHDMPAGNKLDASLRYRWVIAGGLKLIAPNPQGPVAVERGQPELYDLLKDPQEQSDLAPQRPDDVQRLKGELDRWWSPG